MLTGQKKTKKNGSVYRVAAQLKIHKLGLVVHSHLYLVIVISIH